MCYPCEKLTPDKFQVQDRTQDCIRSRTYSIEGNHQIKQVHILVRVREEQIEHLAAHAQKLPAAEAHLAILVLELSKDLDWRSTGSGYAQYI